MGNIRFVKKIMLYIVGLFIMALGIAFSVKSNLGVSPVSSIPYVLSRITGWTLGIATILVYVFCMALQAIVLRRDYRPVNLLQLVISFLFGYFTDAAIFLTSFLPVTENYVVRFIYLAVGIAFVALGVLFYLTTSLLALPTDGTVQAIAFKGGFKLHKVKIINDCVYTAVALALSLIFLGGINGLGIGTVIAAFGVGRMLGVFSSLFKEKLLRFLGTGTAKGTATVLPSIRKSTEKAG